ncbi:MAG: ATP-binding cassette domain-containing protein [Pseudonocardiaceae bacterium]|nr:ATP-binding cassette domain-containing protein [Pseudonocardiaceae bacterium]
MASAISISGLVVRRSGHPVLHGIDLEVAANAVTGLLGPSGSGKTTLLRTVVGLQRSDAGAVQVLGRPVGHARLRSEIGYMTQEPSVYGDLTVAGNLRYHAALHRRGRRAVDDGLDAVGLTALASRTVATLSNGERSRVSLGCALVAGPRLLLLDEPTVGLDPVLRRDLWELFRTLARDGVTLLVSSHVMDEADRCEHLVLLREGRVVATGTPAGLRATTGAATMEQVFLRLVEGAHEEVAQ